MLDQIFFALNYSLSSFFMSYQKTSKFKLISLKDFPKKICTKQKHLTSTSYNQMSEVDRDFHFKQQNHTDLYLVVVHWLVDWLLYIFYLCRICYGFCPKRPDLSTFTKSKIYSAKEPHLYLFLIFQNLGFIKCSQCLKFLIVGVTVHNFILWKLKKHKNSPKLYSEGLTNFDPETTQTVSRAHFSFDL